MNVEFLVNALEMLSDGVNLYAEVIGNLFVKAAAGETLENLQFAFREFLDFRGGSALLVKVLHDLAGNLAGHG